MFSSLLPIISKGVQEVEIMPFEPLKIPQIKVERNEEVIALLGSFDNVLVRGASNSSVSNAFLDLEKKILKFNLDIPRLKLNASYNLKGISFSDSFRNLIFMSNILGNIFLLPLVGSGDITILLKNVRTSVMTRISLRKIPEVCYN